MQLPLIVVWLVLGAGPKTVEEAFQTGNEFMQARKYCEALGAYRAGLALDPKESGLLSNGGLAALQCGDFAAAQDLLSRLKTLEPDDWQVRAKLVQSYQGLGKTAERDRERAELMEMRKRGGNQDLAAQAEYCRERFEAGASR